MESLPGSPTTSLLISAASLEGVLTEKNKTNMEGTSLPSELGHPFPLSWNSPWEEDEIGIAQSIKKPPAMQEIQVRSLGREDPQEESTATHCSNLAWRIPWTEEPGRLQFTGSQNVRHD